MLLHLVIRNLVCASGVLFWTPGKRHNSRVTEMFREAEEHDISGDDEETLLLSMEKTRATNEESNFSSLPRGELQRRLRQISLLDVYRAR